MLRTGIALGCFSALISLSLASACTGTQDDCANTSTCNSGGSSAAGKSGDGGKSGSPSGGSTSGDAGETTGGTTNGGGTSGMSGLAGAGGGGGGGGSECDTTKNPTDEACLVSDDYAIFVAPDGDDGNAGGKDSPLASMTKAVELAAGNKLVLVCSGTYDEHVSITAGARIFGGFKCTDWSVDNTKPLFKPATAGPALKVDGVTAELLVESVSFEVPDAVAAGETALTAIVIASPKVTFRSVSLTAGKGKAGADAANAGYDLAGISLNDLNGNNGTVTDGGSGSIFTCPGGATTKRGSGGDPPDQNGGAGTPPPNDADGKGGDSTKACGAGGGGLDGAAGPDAPSAVGASALGIAAANGWKSNSGANGGDGSPGQGGGGGAGKAAGGGGSGGAGGCGGKGGPGGAGAGASIALIALDSAIAISSSLLTTADAGNGGHGAAGQNGMKVTPVGGDGFGTGCDGGLGGPGGNGGAGGGGAGGVSAGIVWKGAVAPTVSVDTTVTIGKAGTKGAGGIPGTNDGIAGVAQKVLPLN